MKSVGPRSRGPFTHAWWSARSLGDRLYGAPTCVMADDTASCIYMKFPRGTANSL
jgi:hypothetical protein